MNHLQVSCVLLLVQVSQGNRLELWHPKEKNLNNLLVSEQDLDKTSQIRVLDFSRENDQFKKIISRETKFSLDLDKVSA